jgi:hypothetical protein
MATIIGSLSQERDSVSQLSRQATPLVRADALALPDDNRSGYADSDHAFSPRPREERFEQDPQGRASRLLLEPAQRGPATETGRKPRTGRGWKDGTRAASEFAYDVPKHIAYKLKACLDKS